MGAWGGSPPPPPSMDIYAQKCTLLHELRGKYRPIHKIWAFFAFLLKNFIPQMTKILRKILIWAIKLPTWPPCLCHLYSQCVQIFLPQKAQKIPKSAKNSKKRKNAPALIVNFLLHFWLLQTWFTENKRSRRRRGRRGRRGR